VGETEKLNLARKYRPRKLDEVIGQPLASKILAEALSKDRIAPAYLFCGPRGVGKTTCARIFARAAACTSKSLDKRPCDECSSCKAILSGNSMDLIEIDGASHTGVDDVRSIIESVVYRPSVGRRLIYIIDEVHMLSNAAFNALLKTLEEPPPHALFLFATTEQEKIPATILSRVQRIELKRMNMPEILSNLRMICEKEKIKASENVMEQIAAAADGALRDAQTLLDQMILLSGSRSIQDDLVDQFLGTIGIQQELQLLKWIAAQDVSALLTKVGEFFEKGKDLEAVLSRLVLWTRSLLIVKASGSSELVESEISSNVLPQLQEAFKAWGVEDLDRLFEVLWAGKERIKKSEVPRIVLETTLIRAARIVLTEDLAVVINHLRSGEVATTPARPAMSQTIEPAASRPRAPSPSTTTPSRAPTPKPTAPASGPIETAQDLVREIKTKRPSLAALLQCAVKQELNGDTLEIRFPNGHFAYKQLSEKIVLRELEELIQGLTQNKVSKLNVVETEREVSAPAAPKPPASAGRSFMSDAKKAILSDPDIQKASALLGAEVESVTIEGIKNK
jgi:DNA polymerase-3 subunit gamma/tau